MKRELSGKFRVIIEEDEGYEVPALDLAAEGRDTLRALVSQWGNVIGLNAEVSERGKAVARAELAGPAFDPRPAQPAGDAPAGVPGAGGAQPEPVGKAKRRGSGVRESDRASAGNRLRASTEPKRRAAPDRGAGAKPKRA